MTMARANRFICGAASEWQRVHKYRYNGQTAGLPFALIIVVLTLSAHCHVINCQYTDSTSSPCPDTFQYRSNGYEQYGVGQIRQPPIGEDIHVMVHLIVGARLQSNYYGKVQLTGTPEQIVHKIYNKEPIPFEVIFPVQDPLPLVSSISVNDRIICMATSIPQFNYLTKVTLQYMFKPVVSPNYRPRPTPPAFNNVQSSRPFVDLFSLTGDQVNENNYHIIEISPDSNDKDRTAEEGTIIQLAPHQNRFPPFVDIPAEHNNLGPNDENEFSFLNTHNQDNTFGTTFRNPTAIDATRATTTTTVVPAKSYDIGCGRIAKTFTALAFGGSKIRRGDWPFVTAIHYYKENSFSFRCGGTVISRTAVITAAHCFYIRKSRIKAEDIIVFLGHFNLKRLQEEGSRIVNVASLHVHPEYMTKGSLYSDVAIAKLSEAIEFSEFIQPACIWDGIVDQAAVVGKHGVLVGWGRDEQGNLYTPEPKKVVVPIVSDQTCLRSNEIFVKITNSRTFCAGWRNGTEGPCSGDSGTGLMLNEYGVWYLRGIVSSSLTDSNTGTCNLNEYVVFTDIAQFLPWIRSTLSISG